MIFVLNGISRLLLSIDDGIVICISDLHALKAEGPISVTEEGIVICDNNEHPEKT